MRTYTLRFGYAYHIMAPELTYKAHLNSPLSSVLSHPLKPCSTSQPHRARSFLPHSEAAVDGHGINIASPSRSILPAPALARPTPYLHFIRCNILPPPLRIQCTMPHRFESYGTGGRKEERPPQALINTYRLVQLCAFRSSPTNLCGECLRFLFHFRCQPLWGARAKPGTPGTSLMAYKKRQEMQSRWPTHLV
jgi:hypothetical protein